MRKTEFGLVIAIVVIQAGFILLGLYQERYQFIIDNFIFVFLGFVAYMYFDKLKLNSAMLCAINVFFLLHSLGYFGLYGYKILSIPYDIILHFYGHFVLGILLIRIMPTNIPFKYFKAVAFVVLISSGIGAIQEITEYYGYLVFGKGEGFLRYGLGDGGSDFQGSWENSMTDMAANLVGSVAGIALYLILRNLSGSELLR